MKVEDNLIGSILRFFYNIIELKVMKHFKRGDVNFLDVIKKEKNFELIFPSEAMILSNLSKICSEYPKGDFAEIGCYKGFSSEVIAINKGNKKLYLFDTFGGLPKGDEVNLKSKMYKSNFEYIKKRFKDYKDVNIYKGVFPEETSYKIKDKSFSLVHIDSDLYNGILKNLDFFYPRMIRYGMIIIHDYPSLIGVKQAVDEFFKNKNEIVIPLSMRQVLIIKK